MKTLENWCLAAGGCLFAVGLLSSAARAEYTSSDTRTPSPTYSSTDDVTYTSGHKIDSFFDVFADFQRLPPPAPNTTRIDSFFDVFTEIYLAPPGGPPQLYQVPAQMQIRLNGLPPGTPYFDTEMLQLDLYGGSLPPGVWIRESPTRPSIGRTTQTPLGGGLYQIDSFFDVFTELSIDGGQTWNPGATSMRITGGVPEPSSAVLAVLGAVALIRLGFRRR